MKKPDFSKYPDYEELQAILEEMVSQKPQLAKLYSIGKTHEKRDIWVVEITNTQTGAAELKPAMYIDGNIHAGEVTGSVVCLYTIWYLLSGHGKDTFVTELVDKKAFYIIPRISADGAEVYLHTPYSLRSSTREYPPCDTLEGLVAEDIDGNSLILQMRIEDPDGEWKVSTQDPRLMIKREPWDTQGPFYKVFTEGIIENWDGKDVKTAPPKWGLDINRNFPANWVPEAEQRGAGPYPLSEPETRAVADFIVGHPNIGAAMAYHTTMGAILRPSCTRPDDGLPRLDVDIYKTIGQKGTELTGYPHVSTYEEYTSDKSRPLRGVFMDWLYEHMGVITFSTELWDAHVRAGNKLFSMSRMSEESQLSLLKWNDRELSGQGFVAWHGFDHPQLGRVEIGGWKSKFVLVNPPPQYLEPECHKNCLFTLYHAACLPELAVELPVGERIAPEIYRVSVCVKNKGFKPTNTSQQAIEVGRADPVKVEISGPGIEFILGKPAEEIGHLHGLPAGNMRHSGDAASKKYLEWVIRAQEGTRLSIVARSQRAGTSTAHVVLE
ncbi:MAG TPA: carboxypeptidase [Firmicutes bacterium]|nr:carboxypeptidase [Candidatus Fermentithermobacillaceae bacterium]